jgi:hypothetical protein
MLEPTCGRRSAIGQVRLAFWGRECRYPGGVVDRVVVALGNGDYEVHYIGVNWPHHIFVNQDFQVIGADD